MKIVIIGFNDYNKLDKELNYLIEESQFFLFTVVCGGTSSENKGTSLGEQWAAANGAPVEYLFEENPEILLSKLAQTADFGLIDLTTENQYARRLAGMMKNKGKHGRIIR